MRNIILIILGGYFSTICSFAQTTINGKMQSFCLADFKLVYSQSALNEFQGETLSTGKTNEIGQFSTSFAIPSEQLVLLFISDHFYRLWIVPNTTLTIIETGDAQFKFIGQGATENTFLFKSGIMNPVATPTTISATAFEPQQQLLYLDSIEEKRKYLFETILDSNKISKRFYYYCKGEIGYFSKLNKNQYALHNIYGSNKIKPSDIPSNYYDFWNQFQLLDDSCISDSYKSSIRDYINYNTSKYLGVFDNIPDKETYYKTEFKILDSLLILHQYTKQTLKAERILFLIKYFDLPQLVQHEIKSFESEFPSSKYTTIIQKKWSQKNTSALTNLSFSLKDTSGKNVDIKTLKGKVVYIDFWGSWCKPCLEQMPNSAILQKIFKGKDVSFLFIDFYDNTEKWLRTIREKQLHGIHLKAEKKDLEFFDKTFGVKQGFPRYALVDKNGILITTSAPHPNDDEAVILIDKYLK